MKRKMAEKQTRGGCKNQLLRNRNLSGYYFTLYSVFMSYFLFKIIITASRQKTNYIVCAF